MAKIADITAKLVRELLSYDPETGVLTWRVNRSGSALAGTRAGSTRKSGYRSVHIKGVLCVEHRVIWLYVHGKWPADQVDHINCDRSDNRLRNLRLATNAENQRNCPVRRDNKLGIKGVYRVGRRYRSSIRDNGRVKHLGYFPTKEEAREAYTAAAIRLYGEFARS